MEESIKLQDAKVAWVLPVLGKDGNLLYHKPLLESFALHCGAFRIFTAKFDGDKNLLGCEIERHGIFKWCDQALRGADHGVKGYEYGMSLVTPSVVLPLWRYRPDLMVVNELGLWSIYALFAQRMMPKVRVLLVVEARPRFSQSLWRGLARKIFRTFIINRGDKIITNNIDGANYLRFDLHAQSKKIIVKPYLVSDMAFISGISREDLRKHRSLRGREQPVRFLYVGQLLERKGLQYALKGMAALLPEYKERFIFEVVGDGPFRESLERQVQGLGLSEHVHFLGRQPYSTLPDWYQRSDVFLFPTLGDYRALVPFEALSMGLPIVASINDGGINETVDEGKNGFPFDPRDTAKLSRILIRFIETPALIAEFSKRSLQMASAYTLERATESLVYACQQALDT